MLRRDLVPKIKELGINTTNIHESLFDFVCGEMGVSSEAVDQTLMLSQLRNLVVKLRTKFSKTSRSYEKLLDKEDSWLSENIEIPLLVEKDYVAGSGRPRKSWDTCGERAKRAKVAD